MPVDTSMRCAEHAAVIGDDVAFEPPQLASKVVQSGSVAVLTRPAT